MQSCSDSESIFGRDIGSNFSFISILRNYNVIRGCKETVRKYKL